MLVTVLGANGPTGRLLCKKLVYGGHSVRALTRHLDAGGLSGLDITVIGGDATIELDLRRALRGAEAVVSVLGTPYSKDPISLYSDSARTVTRVLAADGPGRLVVTSSAALSSWQAPARTPRNLLAAMHMPRPVPQTRTPRSASPRLTCPATRAAMSG